MGGWGSLLDRITSWLPIQTKEERLRNEIDKLEDRQLFIKRNKRNDLADEYERNANRLNVLYEQAKNRQ